MKIGDYIKSNINNINGYIYEISPSGKTVKLQDRYGNKEAKWFNMRRDLGL